MAAANLIGVSCSFATGCMGAFPGSLGFVVVVVSALLDLASSTACSRFVFFSKTISFIVVVAMRSLILHRGAVRRICVGVCVGFSGFVFVFSYEVFDVIVVVVMFVCRCLGLSRSWDQRCSRGQKGATSAMEGGQFGTVNGRIVSVSVKNIVS
jgi:uncharacterized membrane protein